MKKLLLSTTALAIFASGTAFADDTPVYDYVSVNYLSANYDDDDFLGVDYEPTGFQIEGSKLITENFYVIGSYDRLGEDYNIGGQRVDVDVDTWRAGVGFLFPLSRTSHLFVEPAWVRLEGESDGFTAEEDGYGVKAGINQVISNTFHVKGYANYVDVDDVDDTTFGVEGRVLFTENWHGIAGIEGNGDGTVFKLGASFAF
jgi:hypothetical protein